MPMPVGKLPPEMLAELLGRVAPDDPAVVVGPGIGRDVAVLDVGNPDSYLLAKTDPITFATDEIGHYAVCVNSNDIATTGGLPRFMLGTLLLPKDTSDPALARDIFDQLHRACKRFAIALVGGHTEVTAGLDRPILVGMMLGEVARECLITSAGAQVGDRVLLTKRVAVEGTSLIARELADDLRRRGYDEPLLARARGMLHDPGISVLAEAQAAVGAGHVHAMHDPTEGGVATGLHELAMASEVGLAIEGDSIPVFPETERLCSDLGLDPLGLIASGSLLIVAPEEASEAIIAACGERGIACADIGQVRPASEGVRMRRGGRWRDLPRYDQDELTRLF